jgi:hypothetical protein
MDKDVHQMKLLIKKILKKMVGIIFSPPASFPASEYLRHYPGPLEELASLGLPITGSAVLTAQAGIGDHRSFF